MRFSGSSRATSAVIGVSLTLVAATVALVLFASGQQDQARARDPQQPSAVVGPEAMPDLTVVRAVSSLAVLRDWDTARSRAWARGSVPALRRLYLPHSRAGARDVAMLDAWRERGLRVEGMRMQVLAVELVRRTDRRLVLRVTDRLVGAVAVPAPGSAGAGGRDAQDLPQDRATTRRLEFVRPQRASGRWLLAAVYDREASTSDSPASSTAPTSGSANS